MVQGPFPILMKLPEPAEVVVELPFEFETVRAGSAARPSEREPPVPGRKLGQLPVPWPAPSFDEVYL